MIITAYVITILKLQITVNSVWFLPSRVYYKWSRVTRI